MKQGIGIMRAAVTVTVMALTVVSVVLVSHLGVGLYLYGVLPDDGVQLAVVATACGLVAFMLTPFR